MKRSHLLLVVGAALLLVVGLLALPTGVLRNANKPAPGGATRDAGTTAGAPPANGGAPAVAAAGTDQARSEAGAGPAESDHSHREVTVADRQTLNRLRTALAQPAPPATRANRAAELAAQYGKVQVFDSAGYYYEQAAQAQPSEKYWQLAADQYFEALGFAATPERAQALGQKAQNLYQKVLEANPQNLAAKTNLAMTYVSSPQPMQGILLLREVLAADPTNAQALYNLGILSLQSGQNDKAVGRFTDLVKAHPSHVNGNFYLGVALAREGKPAEARTAFERTLTLSKEPSLRASVEQELAKLPR